jgi:hypothetical protein
MVDPKLVGNMQRSSLLVGKSCSRHHRQIDISRRRDALLVRSHRLIHHGEERA